MRLIVKKKVIIWVNCGKEEDWGDEQYMRVLIE